MMEKLAILRGVIYEGDDHYIRAIYPTPVISPASCDFISTNNTIEVVFREDSFDPVTRIRRGRLYIGGQLGKAWNPDRVDEGFYRPAHPPPNFSITPEFCGDSWQQNVTSEEVRGQIVQIGGSGYQTSWRVVGLEKISIGDTLFTLRATSLLGALPDLADKIADNNKDMVDAKPVRDAMNALADALHKQQPVSTVDVARETARVILSAWIGADAQEKDLKDVINKIPAARELITNAALVVNRLHPRGKSAERERQANNSETLRPIDDLDAETCVHLIGLILRDIGWAAP